MSHPSAVTIRPVQCSSVVQPSLIPQQSLYCQFSSARLYSQDSSHSIHYAASSVQLCFTAKSYPTTVTILPVQCSSVVQPSLIPQHSLYRKFSAALLYSQVSSNSGHHTESSVQLCCTTKSHPSAVTILLVQCSSVVQPSLIPQHSLYCQFSAALLYSQDSSHSSVLYCQFSSARLYSQDSSHSSHYTASSVQLCCTAKSHPTAVAILPV